MISPSVSIRMSRMTRRKPKAPIAHGGELAVRALPELTGLLPIEHFALEFARLIKAVHDACLAQARIERKRTDQEWIDEEATDLDIIDRGLLILSCNERDVFERIAANSKVQEQVARVDKATNMVGQVLTEAFGLAGDARISVSDVGNMGVEVLVR
jgi:hypothetical protein